ncbi:hypothetical protein B0H13DRAFT_2318768 [Mycena leptocephala]|nr:hypothetical protein B0H13DRAFT_2318768 [Mycena leptocephala]
MLFINHVSGSEEDLRRAPACRHPLAIKAYSIYGSHFNALTYSFVPRRLFHSPSPLRPRVITLTHEFSRTTPDLATRKRRHENSDLYETGERSRTSKWRDENQITKKARIINAQSSIANLFKPAEKKQSGHSSGEVSIVYLHDAQPHVLGPNLSSKLQAAEHAQVDSDSDIEMISATDSSPLDPSESHPSVPPIEHTLGPVKSPAVSSTAAPAPASASESADVAMLKST